MYRFEKERIRATFRPNLLGSLFSLLRNNIWKYEHVASGRWWISYLWDFFASVFGIPEAYSEPCQSSIMELFCKYSWYLDIYLSTCCSTEKHLLENSRSFRSLNTASSLAAITLICFVFLKGVYENIAYKELQKKISIRINWWFKSKMRLSLNSKHSNWW